MTTTHLTADRAARIHRRTAEVVARIHAEADALEAAGDPLDNVADTATLYVPRHEAVATLRALAVSRQRATAAVTPGTPGRTLNHTPEVTR